MTNNFNIFKVLVSMATLLVLGAIASSPINVWLNSLIPSQFKQAVVPITISIGAMTLVGGVWWVFDRFLWRVSVIRELFDIYPCIAGRWEGELVRENDESKHSLVIEIVQSLTKITVKTYTKSNNMGVGISVQLLRDINSHGASFVYSWRGSARKTATYKGGEYYGTAIFDCSAPGVMSGHYYTNRPDGPTAGNISVKYISKKLQNSFGMVSSAH